MPIYFENPLELVIKAAARVCPTLDVIIQFDEELACPPYGETCWLDNGTIIISLAANISVLRSLEILGHELAHAIAGEECAHGDKWEESFEDIELEYARILEERKQLKEKNREAK